MATNQDIPALLADTEGFAELSQADQERADHGWKR